MLNWGFLANYDNDGNVDNFVLGTSNLNPLSLKYGTRRNSGTITSYAGDNTISAAKTYTVAAKTGVTLNNQANVSNTVQDSYYVNFLWHLANNIDVGFGTKLNWQVGQLHATATGFGKQTHMYARADFYSIRRPRRNCNPDFF